MKIPFVRDYPLAERKEAVILSEATRGFIGSDVVEESPYLHLPLSVLLFCHSRRESAFRRMPNRKQNTTQHLHHSSTGSFAIDLSP